MPIEVTKLNEPICEPHESKICPTDEDIFFILAIRPSVQSIEPFNTKLLTQLSLMYYCC